MPSTTVPAGTAAAIDHALRTTFGLPSLRTGQRAVIERVLSGQPTLAVMPTGAGKSLCYQLPAVLLPGRTVVVSPLVALMRDQCEGLRELGIAAVEANASLDADALRQAEAAIADGSAKIVLTTPERLASPDFMALFHEHPTSLLVVDEAHCISQWGHDFRPAFLDIAPAAKALGRPAVLALTATAAGATARDICQQLGIPAAGVIDTGTYRPNLQYRVEPLASDAEKLARTIALVQATAGCGLVYAATIRAAQAVHDALAGAGESVALYHGRLAATRRREVQDAFMDGRTRIVVATNAFGLGIDKQDIRFVLHYQLPSGLDAYYQESGRAGRDGEAATCTLLFLRKDRAVQQFFLAGRYPAAEDVQALYAALQEPPPAGESESGGKGGWTLEALQARLGRPRNKLQVGLGVLRAKHIAARDTRGRFSLRRAGLDTDTLAQSVAAYREKREGDNEALERMVFYAQTGRCRWQVLLDYFGHAEETGSCGSCDNCRRIAEHQAAQAGQAGPGRHDTLPEAAGDTPRTAPAGPPQIMVAAPPPPAAHAAFAAGQPVTVRRYGKGVVRAADAWSVTVEFADGNSRCFQPDFIKPAARPRGHAAGGAVPVSAHPPAIECTVQSQHRSA